MPTPPVSPPYILKEPVFPTAVVLVALKPLGESIKGKSNLKISFPPPKLLMCKLLTPAAKAKPWPVDKLVPNLSLLSAIIMSCTPVSKPSAFLEYLTKTKSAIQYSPAFMHGGVKPGTQN